jgi:hypothetical protein
MNMRRPCASRVAKTDTHMVVTMAAMAEVVEASLAVMEAVEAEDAVGEMEEEAAVVVVEGARR